MSVKRTCDGLLVHDQLWKSRRQYRSWSCTVNTRTGFVQVLVPVILDALEGFPDARLAVVAARLRELDSCIGAPIHARHVRAERCASWGFKDSLAAVDWRVRFGISLVD